MRGRKLLLVLLAVTTAHGAAHAEKVREQCQTEESRGLRYVARAMAQAAEEANPWHNTCNGCSFSTLVFAQQEVTQKRFAAEGRAALLKARALEATRCPALAEAIMSLGPATDEERAAVAADYAARMQKARDELAAQVAWRAAHPQCRHVVWFASCSGHPTSASSATIDTDRCERSPEDFSGRHQGQAGRCSADGRGPAWRGADDPLEKLDPATNPLIAQVACADALVAAGLGGESWYADPKICGAP